MNDIDNTNYTGKIFYYNGNYGYIFSELGITYFIKTCIKGNYYPQKDDVVEFDIEILQEKHAIEIRFIENINSYSIKNYENYKIGIVKSFDEDTGIGFINSYDNIEYIVYKKDLLIHCKIISGDIVVFFTCSVNLILSAKNCQLLQHVLYSYSNEFQEIILKQYLSLNIKSFIPYSVYNRINKIVKHSKISDQSKIAFLKFSFQKAIFNYQYEVVKEGIVLLDKNEQNEFLEKINIELLSIEFFNKSSKKSISTQGLLNLINLEDFILNPDFKAANIDYQCIMIIDGLNALFGEEQFKLLESFLNDINIIDDKNYKQIKKIIKYGSIIDVYKNKFIATSFNKSDIKIQFDMIAEKYVCLTIEEQTKFLKEYLLKFSSIDFSNYKEILSIAKLDSFHEATKISFFETCFYKTYSYYKFKILLTDNLIGIDKKSSENQIKFLLEYLLDFDDISLCNYEEITSIANSEKIKLLAKNEFLKYAFEKADNEYKYKMLFEDNLIDIENKTFETQIKYFLETLLEHNKINYLFYDQIKLVANSKLFIGSLKKEFLKNVFKKVYPDFQYKMLFEDNLIDIENETYDNQIDLLMQYLINLKGLSNSNYEQIKSIAISYKIKDLAKNEFLKKVFDKACSEYQYKMLFEDNLISFFNESSENQIDFLLKINRLDFYKIKSIVQSDNVEESVKNVFLKAAFLKADKFTKVKMLFEDSLFNIENEMIDDQVDFFNQIGELDIDKIKSILLSRNITENNKFIFLKIAFENANIITKNRMIFKESLIDYSEISKIDCLRLWLNNLNPNYNYIEFVQTAWQLSNDERKLLNKRIREYAKDERLLNFINQIPKVEIIEKTANYTIYKCKWRNLYYHNGYVQVFLDKNLSTEAFRWDAAREEWNLLTQEYFNNRKIDDIILKVNDLNNNIIEIEGLQDIEVKIIVAEVRKYGSIENVREISSSQLTRIIHNVSARNQCVNFLASQQSDYNVIDIHELVSDNYGSIKRDISFLFLIPDGKGNLYFVWESIEFEKSKATHIFKSLESDFDNNGYNIKNFIENNLRSRTLLNSTEIDDIKKKEELNYFCRIDHNMIDYLVWENRMKEAMPFLI